MDATVDGMPFMALASAWAASLPELSSSAATSWRTVYRPPGPMPALLPSTRRSSALPSTTASGSRRPRDQQHEQDLHRRRRAVPGVRGPRGEHVPVSRSATTKAAATTAGTPAGPRSPQPARPGPPTAPPATAAPAPPPSPRRRVARVAPPDPGRRVPAPSRAQVGTRGDGRRLDDPAGVRGRCDQQHQRGGHRDRRTPPSVHGRTRAPEARRQAAAAPSRCVFSAPSVRCMPSTISRSRSRPRMPLRWTALISTFVEFV